MMLRAVISNVDSSVTTQGFREEADEFIPEDDPDVNRIRDSFSSCAVMPLSKLTVNETGVDNGDITFFFASFYVRKKGRVVCELRCRTKGRGRGVDTLGNVPWIGVH